MQTIIKLIIITLVYQTITSCTSQKDIHGYRIKTSNAEEVKIGQTKQEVYGKLGSPSSLSSFGQETWYYISQDLEKKSIAKEDVKDSNILALEFSGDVVSNISTIGKDSYKDIAFTKEKTPSEGTTLSATEQFLGNLGKFNSNRNPISNNNPGRNY